MIDAQRHRDERQLVCEAFRRVFGREPNRTEAQYVQAVSFLESTYGLGWSGNGKGSRNRGAITAGREWIGDTFQARDSRPPTRAEIDTRRQANLDALAAGNAEPWPNPYAPVWYVTNFRSYRTEIDAVIDLVKQVYLTLQRDEKVLPFARKGDTRGASQGLYDTHYYTGTHVNPATNVDVHHGAVLHAITEMARALGEPMPDGSEPAPLVPVLRLGAQGDSVKAVQHVVGAKEDGIFGRQTEAQVKAWQRLHGLRADGLVGPLTRKAMGL